MNVDFLVGAILAAATPQTGNAHVDAFVADIMADRRDAALGRIMEMNSLSGRPNAVALASEFVEKLVQCTFVSSQTRGIGSGMYDLRWHCPDGDYFSLLDPTYRPPRLVVGEFLSAAAREQRRRAPLLAPLMPSASNGPPLSDAERVRIVTEYLDGIRPGGSAQVASITFRLHFMDRRQPDSFVGPEQLGRYLAPCRTNGEPIVARSGLFAGGVAVRWSCTGQGALDAELTTIMNFYQGRVIAGTTLVGPVPNGVP